MITKMKGVSLGVVTADCTPIILYDVKIKLLGVSMQMEAPIQTSLKKFIR